MFNTVKELETYLKDHTDLCMIRRYWVDVIREEADVLFSMDLRVNKEQASKRRNIDDAKELYLAEINYFIENDFKPTAMTIMGYRRKPHAWVIADTIKQYQVEH